MSLYEVIASRNASGMERTAICQMQKDGVTLRTLTYRQLFDGIERYYQVLLRAGYQPGDRIGICGAACPEWHMAFYAISRLGCTCAALDHSYSHEEMVHIAKKARLQGLYLTDATAAVLDDPMEGVNLYRLEDGTQTQSCPRAGETPFANPEAEVLIFSSGTTSTAAGILHSAESALRSVEMILHCNYADTDKERFMAFLPNSHIYGLYAQCLAPALHQSSVCYMEELSAACIMGAFGAYHPTIFCGVPKVYELLYSSIQQKIQANRAAAFLVRTLHPLCLNIRRRWGLNPGKVLFSSINQGIGGSADILVCGGAPMRPEVADFFFGAGFRVLITYGATETSIPTLGNYGKHLTTDSCGRPYPGVEMKLSEDGELLLKNPSQMLGYFDDPERTAEAYTPDGWFRTGDLASLDQRGNVHINGRCKENIVLATGKKVAPDDIEANYAGLPGVKDFTACGIPCGEDGSYDEVHCFVVQEEQAETEAVEAAFRSRSAESPQNMKLHGIHFVPRIPRTALGKPKRYQLRKLLEAKRTSVEEALSGAPRLNTVEEKVSYVVQQVTGQERFTQESRLKQDLALDSLSAVELCVQLEKLTGVRIDDMLHQDATVGDLMGWCSHPETVVRKKLIQYPLTRKNMDYTLMNIAWFLIRTFYKVTVRGANLLPTDTGYIICANHVSNFDYLYLTLTFRKERLSKLCCMAKQELFQHTWLNQLLCRVGGMVPIDRTGAVGDSMHALAARLKEKWGVLAFPEGTRSKDGHLAAFKKGPAMLAVQTGVPIVPVCIKGGFEIFPRNHKLPNLFNFKTGHRYRVQVLYGAPIDPAGKSPEALTALVQQAVAELEASV